MTDVMQANNKSHLETIDYKPKSVTLNTPERDAPVSTSTLGVDDEKKVDDHDDHEDDDHDDGKFDLYSEEAEWDEGGKSHCGYSEAVHATLMSVGETVHAVIGEPSPQVEKELKAVGNWFQEASYAARDLFRGPREGEESSGMKEDALDAVKTLLRGGSKDSKKLDQVHDENKDPATGNYTAPEPTGITTPN
jgi:hypothetical protein